ncbi:hypothetical protein ACQW02_09055 [Humitalea sp. 24SJ18S-53]|uniref:hypothetical protein n=1 Tax=Humitalea sp. 24SJ18S-53 TaxID=3422307 RepID=UPI003D671775
MAGAGAAMRYGRVVKAGRAGSARPHGTSSPIESRATPRTPAERGPASLVGVFYGLMVTAE